MNGTVLITGATGGLGREFASIFAKNGYDLILTAKKHDALSLMKTELESEHSVAVMVIAKDLSDDDATSDIFNAVVDSGSKVDILVNNAGFGDFSEFSKCDLNKQEEMIRVNILALTRLTRLFLPEMIRSDNGKILNLSSIAGFEPGPYMSVYYASKSFVLSFSEALSRELRGTNVTVTVLCPGPTRTGFDKAAGEGAVKMFSSIRPADPKEVVEYSYKMLMKGKVIAVPGIGNKFLIQIQRVLPRSTVRSFVARIQTR